MSSRLPWGLSYRSFRRPTIITSFIERCTRMSRNLFTNRAQSTERAPEPEDRDFGREYIAHLQEENRSLRERIAYFEAEDRKLREMLLKRVGMSVSEKQID